LPGEAIAFHFTCVDIVAPWLAYVVAGRLTCNTQKVANSNFVIDQFQF
jgi:hypothetical protein